MTILLIDDEPAVARLYGAAIQQLGFDVKICGGAEEALEWVRRVKPMLLLTDVEMPDMSGLDLCRRLAKRGAKPCPILFLTAHDTAQAVAEGLACGADDFLLKGMPLDAVLDRVRFWLVSGFKRLPHTARQRALEALEEADPKAPLLAGLGLNRSLVAECMRRLHLEVQATPLRFGNRLIERIAIVARASYLLHEAADSVDDALRFADGLHALIGGLRFLWARDMAVLFGHYDALADDPRFLEMGRRPLAHVPQRTVA